MMDKRVHSRSNAPRARSARTMVHEEIDLPYSESEFLVQLGTSIRASREHCGMSRRELARRTGISDRYIASIEAGKGNVSIVLLLRIAYAIRRAQSGGA